MKLGGGGKIKSLTAARNDKNGKARDVIFIPGMPRGHGKFDEFSSIDEAYGYAVKLIDKRLRRTERKRRARRAA